MDRVLSWCEHFLQEGLKNSIYKPEATPGTGSQSGNRSALVNDKEENLWSEVTPASGTVFWDLGFTDQSTYYIQKRFE